MSASTPRSYVTGIAWVARRSILEKHGLYDAMIIGGGDRAMLHAMYGEFDKEMQLHHLNKSQEEHYLKWAEPYYRDVAGKVGHVSGRVYHLWHGEFITRNYSSRHRLFADYGFEPEADLVVGRNGAWRWARPRPEMESFLATILSAGRKTNRQAQDLSKSSDEREVMFSDSMPGDPSTQTGTVILLAHFWTNRFKLILPTSPRSISSRTVRAKHANGGKAAT